MKNKKTAGGEKMNELIVAEIVQGCISLGAAAIGSAATFLISRLFVTRNIEKQELAKMKAEQLGNVLHQMLAEGKINYVEYYKCSNLISIAKLADRMLVKNIFDDEKWTKNSEKYSFDWFMRFYEYAGCVSNEDAQKLWAAVLAKEIENPNTIPLSLLHCLSIMERDEADFFCNISKYVLYDFKDHSPHLLLFVSSNRDEYKEADITPANLKKLERLGLIECDFVNEYVFFGKKYFISGNHSIKVFGNPDNNDRIKAGNVVLTRNGKILFSIIDEKYKQFNSRNVDFIVNQFRHRNCRISYDDKSLY